MIFLRPWDNEQQLIKNETTTSKTDEESVKVLLACRDSRPGLCSPGKGSLRSFDYLGLSTLPPCRKSNGNGIVHCAALEDPTSRQE